jgi:DNA repair exonuclease SbcCD ATPase subunit
MFAEPSSPDLLHSEKFITKATEIIAAVTNAALTEHGYYPGMIDDIAKFKQYKDDAIQVRRERDQLADENRRMYEDNTVLNNSANERLQQLQKLQAVHDKLRGDHQKIQAAQQEFAAANHAYAAREPGEEEYKEKLRQANSQLQQQVHDLNEKVKKQQSALELYEKSMSTPDEQIIKELQRQLAEVNHQLIPLQRQHRELVAQCNFLKQFEKKYGDLKAAYENLNAAALQIDGQRQALANEVNVLRGHHSAIAGQVAQASAQAASSYEAQEAQRQVRISSFLIGPFEI